METCKIRSLLPLMLLSLTAAAQTDALKLRIDGNNYYDETIVRFVNDATPGYDANYDAWKLFSPNAQVPSIYTRIDSVSPLSINALPALVQKTVVDVHADVNAGGTYTITPIEVGVFQPGVCITLEDIATGSYYDMRSGLTPSFNLSAGNNNGAPRFRLHFSVPVTFTVTDALCYGSNDGTVILNKAGVVNWFYSMSDSTGNSVATGTGISGSDTVNNLSAGTYTLTLMAPFGCPETASITVNQPASLQPSFVPSDSVAYQSQAMIHFNNTSGAANAYTWDFGDGSPLSSQSSPVHTYTNTGDFVVTLIASSGLCQEIASGSISVLPDIVSGLGDINGSGISIFASGNSLILEGLGTSQGLVSVFDLSGREVLSSMVIQGGKVSIDLSFPAGYYLVKVQQSGDILVRKIFLGGEIAQNTGARSESRGYLRLFALIVYFFVNNKLLATFKR